MGLTLKQAVYLKIRILDGDFVVLKDFFGFGCFDISFGGVGICGSGYRGWSRESRGGFNHTIFDHMSREAAVEAASRFR